MKRLQIPPSEVRYQSDCDRIVSVCALAGYEVSVHAANFAWEAYSDTYAAGWLRMDSFSDEGLVQIVRQYLTEAPDAE